ncbi:MAG: 4-alpha-glucanotransferase [Thermoleophilaceae bacterium]
MRLPRSSGVQLHPTSLPSGRLDGDAYAFVDWLARAGQSWWQMLPLGPPDRYGSPYKAASAFAAWPGLLAEPDAPVSAAQEDDFRARHAFWIGAWERFAGRGAVADQVRFEREWSALRGYAVERGVRLIGDIPIYVAPRSADHRAWPELFQDGFVAGTPPDTFTKKGQLWGNPLYDWPANRRRRYRWWIERFRRTFELFDLARLDHFRGLVAYWAVPAGARDALGGHWKRGPGRALFDAATRALGTELPLIAEDLGVITPPVERLRDELGLPGMVVLQFGFDDDHQHSPHRLANHAENRIVYTGTHDSDTVRGWWDSLDAPRRATVERALDERGIREREPEWALIRLAFTSRARVAMVQAQDVLGLGRDARMNIPGEKGTAWRWKLEPGVLTARLAERLRAVTREAGRLP